MMQCVTAQMEGVAVESWAWHSIQQQPQKTCGGRWSTDGNEQTRTLQLSASCACVRSGAFSGPDRRSVPAQMAEGAQPRACEGTLDARGAHA